ncbi:DUF3798 domain-containing protein [Alkalicella caledoniensis]|uniref:DUF3798 domain-containing protein n=1 Tax=Alkalicella caledoniensis TaxID=2731377 RepID=A0A7G9W5R0_ALKCA|nr:DUF3798 domain-containing protein [Alkalicella caledoniensis]QNO14022.1 DUF3798 domain-containing protein [Alkalicella caledoniensis]
MFKKLFILLLVAIMALSLAACDTSDTDDNADGTFKIGIMTGTVSQGEEEFRMAQDMLAKYPDMIVTTTYPDRFMQEVETTITNMMAMADDPDVKAIVMVQAVPGAAAAIDRVREVRPDMLFILGAPQEDQDLIKTKGDIILNTDDLGRGEQIAQQAHDMGAKTLVHYSFPRHMSIEFLAVRRDRMKAEAQRLGMTFVEVDAPDPTGDAGVPGTQQFINEDVPRRIAEYGEDTALFATNCSMMEPLIRQTIEHKGIFPVQCCPSPYHAYPAALAIPVPEEFQGDLDYILTMIGEKVAEAGASGRVATWPVPVNMMFIEAGVEYAIAYLNGETDGRVDKAKLQSIMEEIAGTSVQLTIYGDEDDPNDPKNYFLYLSDHIVF